MISPNLKLTIPSATNTPGPQYALNIQNCFNRIDDHDHTENNGAKLDISNLKSTSDLNLSNYSLTNLKYIKFINRPSHSNAGTISMVNNNLYWVNGTGAYSFSITNNGSIDVSGISAFTGLPSGTASAYFSSPSFIFKSSTNIAATNDSSFLKIRNTSISSNAVTLKAPTPLTSNYAITLPSSNPIATKILNISSSGNVAANYGVDNTTIEISSNNLQVKDGSITNAKLDPNITFNTITITPQERIKGAIQVGPPSNYNSTGPVTLTSVTMTSSANNKMLMAFFYGANPVNQPLGNAGLMAFPAELSVWYTIEGPSFPEQTIAYMAQLSSVRAPTMPVPFFAPIQGNYTLRVKANCPYNPSKSIYSSDMKCTLLEIG